MSGLDLSHLQALVVFSEERNLIRAAARLGISQPTLTRLFQAAEAGAPAPLFELRGRQKELTAFGTALAATAQTRLAGLRAEVATLATEFARPENIELRIAGRVEILDRLFANLEYGGRVTLLPCGSTAALAKLHSREADLAISDRSPASGNWISRRLFADRFALAVPQVWTKSEATAGEWLRANAGTKPFLEYSPEITSLFGRGSSCATNFAVADWRLIVRRIESGRGWSFVPTSLLRENRGYRITALMGPDESKTFHLTYRREIGRIPGAKALIDAILARPAGPDRGSRLEKSGVRSRHPVK